MPKIMSKQEIQDWEAKQSRGSYRLILENALQWTPLFIISNSVIYYFFGTKPFGNQLIFEWVTVSFFISLGICAYNWFREQRTSEKSLSQKVKN